jgi:hypothetical protein
VFVDRSSSDRDLRIVTSQRSKSAKKNNVL